jgi:hypothetical protein
MIGEEGGGTAVGSPDVVVERVAGAVGQCLQIMETLDGGL